MQNADNDRGDGDEYNGDSLQQMVMMVVVAGIDDDGCGDQQEF